MCFRCQILLDVAQVLKMIISGLTDGCYMGGQRQIRVKDDTKILGLETQSDIIRPDMYSLI